MPSILLKDLPPAEVQQFLQHAIAPRPICLASTVDREGNANLSPFSFFNLFSSNPPIVIFSPARRVRDNSIKHTLENVMEVPEVVINMVSYNMVQQVSLSSCDFEKGVDEFYKAGFTKLPAQLIRPPRVKESPVQLECRVIEIKPLGNEGGAGNLVIAEVLCMHLQEEVLNSEGKIDQQKMDLVARLGGNWYSRTNAPALFEVDKPNTQIGIGIDALPASIKESSILTGNHLGMLGNVHEQPLVDASYHDDVLKHIIQYYSLNPDEMEKELHLHAAQLLNQGNVPAAWQVLLAAV